jgi:putative nucleotidyltransferase with HDIG domain
MNREKALSLLKSNLKNKNLFKHCLAVEAAMQKMAVRFNQRPDEWGLAGLLHDIDYEETKEKPEEHSKTGAAMLRKLGVDERICQAILTHNEAHGIEPESLMAKALYCIDPLTGLIVAAALVLPSKRLADLTSENVLHRFREKSFARGANREIIARSQELLGLSLEEFVKIVLAAMQQIASELGL